MSKNQLHAAVGCGIQLGKELLQNRDCIRELKRELCGSFHGWSVDHSALLSHHIQYIMHHNVTVFFIKLYALKFYIDSYLHSASSSRQ